MKKIIIAMGSKTDLEVMHKAGAALDIFGIAHQLRILSAHRTPHEVADFAQHAHEHDVGVIIAGAGGAAHLPGMIAAYTTLPVIGVPVPLPPLHGNDALLSIVQMPKGIPVATVAIGNGFNAGMLAAQILAVHDEQLQLRLMHYRQSLRAQVIDDDASMSLPMTEK